MKTGFLEVNKTFTNKTRVGFIGSEHGPELVITFSNEIKKLLDWQNGTSISLIRGTGPQKGTLLLIEGELRYTHHSRLITSDRGGKINFGPMASISATVQRTRTVNAVATVSADKAELVISIPDWDTPIEQDVPVIYMNPPHLEYGNQCVELFEFQAQLLTPLVKALDKVLSADQIIAGMNNPHQTIKFLMPNEMANLAKKLREIGLILRDMQGTGYMLSEEPA